MSDDELNKLLKKPVITDAKTILFLNEKGFDLPISVKEIDTLTLSERFSEHPINKNIVGRRWNGQFADSKGYEITAKENFDIETLSEYVQVVSPDVPDCECISMANYGVKKHKPINKIANAVFNTLYGAKWAVFGFDIWNRTISTEKKDIYLNTAEYISGHRQPAEVISPVKCLLQSRVNSNNELTQVSITNITVGELKNVIVKVLNPVSENAVLMGQYIDERDISLKPTDSVGIYEIAIPVLKPWSVTTVFFE